MQEDFLHYIWKHKKFELLNLQTTQYETIEIKSVGQHNYNSGPDFFNSQLKINNQFWAGNVEIHVQSSDWFLHNHENDKAYDNVILHVVWHHDTDVFRKDNSVIPTLELKQYIGKDILNNYKKLFAKKEKWINCENDFEEIDEFLLLNWQERLYFERLEKKSKIVETLLITSKNNWEAVLFQLLAKNFGLNINGEAFFSLAKSIDFSVIQKTKSNLMQLESLLFGNANLLDDEIEDSYYLNLKKEYNYLKQKFNVSNDYVLPVKFFRLRPLNFPTIRLSQLANLYYKESNLFSKIIKTENLNDFYKLFASITSQFWETHYTFQKESKKSTKKITKSFVDLVVLNTILPIKFCYAKQNGKEVNEEIIHLGNAITSEKNAIIDKYNSLKKVSNSALQSQAMLQLKTEYCDKNKCLQCAIGNSLLS